MVVLQDFSFGNFRSFKDIQTLSLSKAHLASAKDKLLEPTHTFEYQAHSFLKTKAIYGANASGKSNVVKALNTFLKILSDSVKNAKIISEVSSFFINKSTPSFFQMIFWIDEVKYRYGFEVVEGKITAEWLYAEKAKSELCYFIREEQQIIVLDTTHFAEGAIYINLTQQGEDTQELLTDTSLFLTVLASFGFGKTSKLLISNLSQINIISGLSEPTMMSYAKEALKNKDKKRFILNLLKKGDTSIENLQLLDITDFENAENSQKDYLVVAKSIGEEEADRDMIYSFEHYESEGTRKLFELSPYLYEAIKEGHPLVIDEFDARFHPLLTKRIVQLFNSEENQHTQFIFVTHDTSLLSNTLLRRDQIEFVEKDKQGASHLYALAEIEGVEAETSFEKDYIHGKYGAVPLVDDFAELVTN